MLLLVLLGLQVLRVRVLLVLLVLLVPLVPLVSCVFVMLVCLGGTTGSAHAARTLIMVLLLLLVLLAVLVALAGSTVSVGLCGDALYPHMQRQYFKISHSWEQRSLWDPSGPRMSLPVPFVARSPVPMVTILHGTSWAAS